MPAIGIFRTGDEAFRFLESRPEFRRIYVHTSGRHKGEPKPLVRSALGDAQWKRYANGMYRYIAEKRDVPSLAWLRGHPLTEGHKERTHERPKPGAEYWIPPKKWHKYLGIHYHHDSMGRTVATEYGTRGEASAAQFIARTDREAGLVTASRRRTLGRKLHPGEIVGQHIVIHLHSLDGRFTRLFEKGGYQATDILRNAGYKRTRGGRWIKDKDNPDAGLERYLVGYINSQIRSQGELWKDIGFYEIYWFDEPVRETIDPRSRAS